MSLDTSCQLTVMETTMPKTYTLQSELLQEMNKEHGLDDRLESKLFYI